MPSRVTCTEVPEAVCPEIVGRISSTSAPLAGESMLGAGGASCGGGEATLVSMANVIETEGLTLPRASCWTAETICVPFADAGAVQVHFPLAFTEAWQTAPATEAETSALAPEAVPVAETETTAAASPVPVKTGRFTTDGLLI